MRWTLPLLLLIASIPVLLAQPKPLLSDLGPNDHARIAEAFLRTVNKEQQAYIRFLSFFNYEFSEQLSDRIQTSQFWVNNLSRESDLELLKQVPTTNSLLYLDLRDYGWNQEAWSAVANREPYFNELIVNSQHSINLRQLTGVQQTPFHVDTIIRGDWFFRETTEQDRSDSYFDLLYAKERFQGKQRVNLDWQGGDYNGSYLKPGRYYYEQNVGNNKSFPKDETDFEKLFGVDLIRRFIKDTQLNLQRGAVVEGGEKGVSIVARQNRLIERTEGPIGWYYKTYDVKETSGKRDFAETLQKDFEFDAGEILARLPNGAQAALLVDSKGKILKVADNRFANDSSDYKYDTRVRNPGSCVVCHESGIIKPDNLIEDLLKSGIDIKFKDRKEARDARSFFLNWERKLKNDQGEYSDFISRTSGFKPGENSLKFKQFRDEYDAQVNLITASREVGLSPDAFKRIAAKSTKARILMLVQGRSIPRKTWEVDGYTEMLKLMSADRK